MPTRLLTKARYLPGVLSERLAERRLEPPTGDAAAAIEQLRHDVGGLVIPDAATQAERTWVGFQQQLQRNILERDPRRFLRWPVIEVTMFVGDEPWLAPELDGVLTATDQRWRAALPEIATGSPARMAAHPATSGNTAHQLYHLVRFTETTGIELADLDLVVEFGGGYGNFARLLYSLGFAGDYVIYDWPVFGALQRYYLQQAARETGLPLERVRAVGTVEPVAEALAQARRSLFVATWSLSESSSALQGTFAELTRPCAAHLIGYQERFGELDNVDAFARWPGRHPELTWHAERIAHRASDHYLFGHRS